MNLLKLFEELWVGAGGDEREEGRGVRSGALVQKLDGLLDLPLPTEGHEIDRTWKRGGGGGAGGGRRQRAVDGGTAIVHGRAVVERWALGVLGRPVARVRAPVVGEGARLGGRRRGALEVGGWGGGEATRGDGSGGERRGIEGFERERGVEQREADLGEGERKHGVAGAMDGNEGGHQWEG